MPSGGPEHYNEYEYLERSRQLWSIGALLCHRYRSTLVQGMPCHMFAIKPRPEPLLACCR